MPTNYESALRERVRQFMDTANTNARGESAQAGGRTYDTRGLDRMTMAELLRFVKEQGVGVDSRMSEVAIDDTDPLVAQFLEQFGARDWGNVEAPDSGNRSARGFVMGYGDPTYGQEQGSILSDSGRILKLPDGRYIREEANINSDEVAGQHRADETQNRESRQALMRVLAGPALVGGLQAAGVLGQGGAAAAGAGAGAEAAGLAGVTAEGVGGVGAGAGGGASFSGLGSGGAGLAGLGEAAAGSGSSAPAGIEAAIEGYGNGAAGAGTGGSSLWQQASSALGGPSGIARGAMGLASLGASMGGGGGGGDGGETNPQNIIEQMANANRVNHNTPFGSRAWTQGADGRWTVNDSMNPEEQANYEQVRGLNSGVSNMARERLAAMLAQGPRKRYDRPLGT